MAAPTAFHMARDGAVLYVRAVGLANMKHAPTLNAVIEAQRDAGVATFIVDLSQCTGMDSTFMGLLVGTAQSLSDAGGCLTVVNPGAGNRRLLAMLGVDQVLQVVDSCAVPDLEFASIESRGAADEAGRAEMVMRAHRHLAALSEANRSKFAPLLAALEADLRRSRENP